MVKGYIYILRFNDSAYYTGSTTDIETQLDQHHIDLGSTYTKKCLPVELIFIEEFQRIDEDFYREKQTKGWSRKKKEALINGEYGKLHGLSKSRLYKSSCFNISIPRQAAA